MKKNILTLAVILTAAVSANAQETLSSSKFFDNWQVGVKAGIIGKTKCAKSQNEMYIF